ncbi:hypothetical protein GQX73_g7636 [Xylaria multiplex]|uniref:RING-type E3 ubiquitin transferase n=1 Tax=Xylaria multiplex TaxID=323545 RepID=A0A7C8N3U9_9PEZI|nr:hypothetical protein GQX73_g7636 [Xylaria multiplex]
MAVAALSALVAKAWFVLSLTFLASLVSAQDASVTPLDLTDYFAQSKMTLVIATAETTENAPFGSPYDIVPLTTEAGLKQTDVSKLPDIIGNIVILDYSNFTDVNYQDKIVFLCCDAVADNDTNWIPPERVLNSIMSNSAAPAAILLYSTMKSICVVAGPHLTYTRLWSMADQVDAQKVHSVLATTNSDPVVASITPSSEAVESQQQQTRPGGTSAIAMSILYSITGLITLLFLLIIATGAVRAHRNPERYGPRASANGRPRRSRARGLAMAMLETLPIVKFGENDQRKPDEENALQNVARAEPQAQDASQGVTGPVPNNAATSESSSEAADNTISQHGPESTPVPTASTPDNAKKENEPEGDHLGCSICTEDFTVGEDVRVLPCDHKFHPACVDPWLVNVSGTCPLCRLDLRPPEDVEREENGEAAGPQDATAAADGHLAPPAETPEPTAAGEETHRRRRSRLFDWNRLRHASVDERLQALRQYRQSQQGSEPAPAAADDERRRSRLTDRLRGRLHLRGDSRSSSTTAAPEDSLPVASTAQH